jgi:hypothetical protein
MKMTIELPDALFEAIKEKAAQAGVTPEQWVLDKIWGGFSLLKAKLYPRPPRTPEEIQAWLDSFAVDAGVSLSDESLRRENIYED